MRQREKERGYVLGNVRVTKENDDDGSVKKVNRGKTMAHCHRQ